jgi:hypothetical protein
MSLKAWWAAKLAMAQASDANKQKIEEYSTAKIVAEYDVAIRTSVKKAEELGVDNETVKQHLNINWWDNTPAKPASTQVNWVELVKAMTPEQKAELKKLLG